MKHLAFCLFLGLGSRLAFGAAFTPGNLVVVQVGAPTDSIPVTTNTTSEIFLNEITIAGSQVQQLALPTTLSGSNHGITVGIAGGGEGYLHRSADGSVLVLGGYELPVGLPGANTSVSGTAARVIAVVNSSGNIDTSTAVTTGTFTLSGSTTLTGTTFFSGIRSVASDNGKNLWWTNNGGSNINIMYTTLSSTTAIQISSSNTVTGTAGSGPGSATSARIFSNSGTSQLYSTSASGGARLIIAGAGLSATTNGIVESFRPTQAGTALINTPGDFFFADMNHDTALDTLWVALDNTSTNAVTSGSTIGVARYSLDISGTWNYQYTLNLAPINTLSASGTFFGVRGMTVDLSGTVPIIYGVTNELIGNHVISILDNGIATGTNSLVNILATAQNNTIFRGIDFAPVAIPEPTTLAALIAGTGLLVGLRRMRGK